MKLPHWIENPDPHIYLSSNYLTLDFENTIIEGDGSPLNEHNSLLLACWLIGGKEKHIRGNEYELAELIEDVESVDFIVCHGGKHELQWLARAGVDISKVLIYDTMLAEHVLSGNTPVGLGLGDLSKRYGFGRKDPYVDLCMKAAICPSTLPYSWLYRRCALDVKQTYGIFVKQLDLLLEQDKLKTTFTRCILTPALADIEFNGMHLDKDRVDESYREYTTRFNELGRKLEAISGGINFRSSVQRADFLYNTLGFSELTDRRGSAIRTASGKPKADSATLDQLKASNSKQREFLKLWKEYNQLASALSKNLEFFKGVVEESNGVFQGVFNQNIAATHRLSSSGRRTKFEMFDRAKSVQFQNMPRQFKKLFSPREERWKMGESDGAQLEFRVAAELGNDPVAKQDIRDGVDVHRYSASVLNKCKEEDVTGEQRQNAKADTFKPLYGGESGTVDQKRYYAAFKNKYKGIASWQETNKMHVLKHKSLQIFSGLEFFWPDTRIEKDDYIRNSTQICNYPVQSIATADIIPIGITRLWHEMKASNMKSFLVNTIHDSAIAELHPDECEMFEEMSNRALTDYVYYYLETVYEYKWTTPLAAGLKIGPYWTEGEEVVYTLNPEDRIAKD